MNILRSGKAQMVLCFYEMCEPVGMENADVTIYDNGVVDLKSTNEEVTTHISRVEIVWSMTCEHTEVEQDKENSKLVHLKKKKTTPEDLH